MKKINLRDYYPYYTQDMIVEVPDEVADILREYKLAEAADFLRTYRHKAYFSLDYDINVEHEAMVLVLTPADIFEQKEENARLYEALASLPEKQRNRITSHFLLGKNFRKNEYRPRKLPSKMKCIIEGHIRRDKLDGCGKEAYTSSTLTVISICLPCPLLVP